MAKIFLIGATGYIGGEVLYRLANSSTKHQIRCLVRDEAKAAIISKAYPDVHTTQGDLDDATLIETESSDVDVVLSLASTKHIASSEAIVKGLSKGTRSGPGYWIQMSGASLFSTPDIKTNRYGEHGGKTYDDLADEDEIWSIVSQTPTRVVEQLVLAQDSAKIKTALIIGPLIYGVGRGPVNTCNIQGPEISRYTLQNGAAFQVGKGQSVWSNIHVRDLSSLIVALVDAASTTESGIWNKDGIFAPENGEMTFGELATLISKAAKTNGFVAEEKVASFDAEKTNELMGHGAVLLGTNAKQTASRARQRLAWKPAEEGLANFVPEMVRLEAKRLSL